MAGLLFLLTTVCGIHSHFVVVRLCGGSVQRCEVLVLVMLKASNREISRGAHTKHLIQNIDDWEIVEIRRNRVDLGGEQ